MKLLRFRVWDKEEKTMDLVGALDWADEKDDQPITCNTRKKKLYRCYGDSDFVLMQFTGLKDKNGKEIYEKDILKHEAHWSDGSEQSIADMVSPFFCGDWSIEPTDCEVIGNIYENPELLKP